MTVIIDDKISKVEEVREGDIIYADSRPNWAGYQFKGNSTATNPIYESKARYYIPTVSKPTYPTYDNNACRVDLGRNPCMLSVWTGLSNTDDGSNIAQAGTIGDVRCNSSSCTIKYDVFLEFYPYPAIMCNISTTSAGDDVSARATSDKKYGGSITDYELFVHNYSDNVGCGVFKDFPMQLSIYADFERPAEGSRTNLVTLPKFTDNTMRGWLYYDNTQYSIQEPYNNDWYIKLDMRNGLNDNIVINAVNSDQFTADYRNSKGT